MTIDKRGWEHRKSTRKSKLGIKKTIYVKRFNDDFEEKDHKLDEFT